MKKTSLLLVVLLSAFVFLLAGCNPAEPTLELDDFELTTQAGKQLNIKPNLVYSGKDAATLQFESDNEDVASVSTDGIVTAVASGLANITISVKEFPDVQAVITIHVESSVPEQILITGKETMKVGATQTLAAAVIPSFANQGVIWISSDPQVATVTQNLVDLSGTVKALISGEVTIIAESIEDRTVKGEFTIKVTESGATDAEIAQDVIDYVKANMPEYVSSTFNLPVYPTKDENILVEYLDASESPLDGVYTLRATKDQYEKIYVQVTVNDADPVKAELQLKVVLDPNNNNIAKAELAKSHFDQYFASIKDGKVTGNLDLYDHLFGVAVTWTTDKAAVISADGVFVKPDNDTTVKLTAKFTSGSFNLTNVVYQVKAIGYTEDEKVAYIQANTLNTINNATIEYSINVPKVDNKFGAQLTWVSDKPAILNNEGKYPDKLLAAQTEVIYDVTINYNVEGFKFERTVEVKVNVKPMTATGKAAYDFEAGLAAEEITYTKHVAYGVGGVADQIIGLPTSLEGHEDVTISWAGVNDEFDADMKVQKQYLLYHPTEIIVTFHNGTDADSIVKLPVNIGVMNEGDFGFTARSTAYSGANHLVTDGMPAADGGTGTVYKLGFAPIYLKSNFTYKDITKDYYFFTAAGNYKEWTSAVTEVVDGKQVLKRADEYKEATSPVASALPTYYEYNETTKVYTLTADTEINTAKKYFTKANNPIADARLAPGWSSCARIYYNNTDQDLYINIADWAILQFNGNAAAVNNYLLHTIGADNIVKTANKPMLINVVDYTLKTGLKADDPLDGLYTFADGVYTKTQDGLKFVTGDTTKYYTKATAATTDNFVEKTLAVGDSLVGLYTRNEADNTHTLVVEGTFAEGSTVKYYQRTSENVIVVPAHGYLFSPAYLDYVNVNAMLGQAGRTVEVFSFKAK